MKKLAESTNMAHKSELTEKPIKTYEYGEDEPISPEIEALYLWGVFNSNGSVYVNKYFNEMSYPSLIKGGFKSKVEAEAAAAGMK